MVTAVGVSVPRKEAWEKVTGAAKYNDDFPAQGILHAKMFTSTMAHGLIKKLDIARALSSPGVLAVITGRDCPFLCGSVLYDRPPLARDKVRYFGEPVAVVVARSEPEAMEGVKLIQAEYQPLPVVHSPSDGMKSRAPLVHENLAGYARDKGVRPEPNTNIAHHVKIRKGDMEKGWAESDTVTELTFSLPKSDHIAMETRNARAEILPDGKVIIHTASQAPFSVKQQLSQVFQLEEGKIIVHTPLVGGAFGGKAPVHLEIVAYIASKAVGGKAVKIANTREEDMVTSPCRMGLEARVKLGATKEGMIKAAEIQYLVDSGAYSDIAPRMAKALAVDCTGPYNIENVWCDAFCVYTNHPYATSFRGFGHAEYTLCIERTLDKLAYLLGMDPLDIRLKNGIRPGDYSPTQVKITASNTGDLQQCLEKAGRLLNWDEGMRLEIGENKIRAKGISCFWKTSNSPPNAVSGVLLTFNQDGSMNVNCGAVEIGPGMKTAIAQILAEKMQMDVNRIHVLMDVHTQVSPEHWKTVASMTALMVGKSVLQAAEDVIRQLKALAGVVLKCAPDDLDVGEEKVFLKADPTIYAAFADIVHGYKYPNGNSIGGQVLGRGSFIMPHLTDLDPETGKGKAGPDWTLGAQGVEVEFDSREFTYRLVKAVTVLDAGKVINPKTARGLVTGGMSMGLGLGSRESFLYNAQGTVLDTSLRTYKVMHFGQNPEYLVEFVATPQIDAPYGARGLAEHGIIGMPAALANALSAAAQVDLTQIPLTPELIWKVKTGGIA